MKKLFTGLILLFVLLLVMPLLAHPAEQAYSEQTYAFDAGVINASQPLVVRDVSAVPLTLHVEIDRMCSRNVFTVITTGTYVNAKTSGVRPTNYVLRC